MSASSMWNVSEADFPALGSPRQKLGYALKYAVLAPTEINWEPWEFQVADAHIELIARNEPAMDAIDPEGRELMISCGAALLYLKLALKHFGCLGRVELFPDLDQPTLAARIHFGFGRERDEQEKLLFTAMTRRHTSPPPREESRISERALTALGGNGAHDRGWVEFARSEASQQRLLEFTRAGNRPSGGTQPRPTSVIRQNDFGNMSAPSTQPPPPPNATLAVVKTKTDDKRGWLAAGHTLAQVILQAQTLGLSWSFAHRAVRQREAREALRTSVGHKGFAQVILRFGPALIGETIQTTSSQTATTTAR